MIFACVKIEIRKGGGNVTAENIVEIVWFEYAAEVQVREFDTSEQYTYTLEY